MKKAVSTAQAPAAIGPYSQAISHGGLLYTSGQLGLDPETGVLALSGGVDSSVVAALLIRAVGRQLVCVHVNHGLLRKGEPEQVIRVFRDQMDANLIYVDATD